MDPARVTTLSPPLPDLAGLPIGEFRTLMTTLGEPGYRGDQIARWIHQRCVVDFAGMTDLPARLRAALESGYRVHAPRLSERLEDAAETTTKFCFELDDLSRIETVRIDRPDLGTRTLCLSSQAGCPAKCGFCRTGDGGFTRNLTAGEIVSQVDLARADDRERPVTNIVYMGMGELLLNFDAVARSLEILTAPKGAALSPRRLTVSTVGVVPRIPDLAALDLPVSLAVSLHAADDDLRSELVPMNRKYGVIALRDAAEGYARATGRRVTYEYVMLGSVNDSEAQALALARFLRGTLCHVNLIEFNAYPGARYGPADPRAIAAFRDVLAAQGIPVTIRRSRGRNILAACGQLAGSPGRTRSTPPKKG